jgi:surface protein
MFTNTIAFNQDIGDWDVSSAINMEGMFVESRRFNGDISSWDVSSVTDMERMFNGASDFDQNISSWDISSVTTMDQMFDRGVENQQPLSNANYNALLIGWSSQTVQSNVVLGADSLRYSAGAGATARSVLTSSPNNWVISDGGQL